MAGLSSFPMRLLSTEAGASLATSEMVVASALVARSPKTLRLASWHEDERIRSCQLYGVRPEALEVRLQCGVRPRLGRTNDPWKQDGPGMQLE